MHIGLYSPAWPPGEMANGVVTYVRIVRTELLRLGHRVSIFSGDCEQDLAQNIYRVSVGSDWPLWRALQRRIGRGWNSEYDFGARIAQRVMQVHARDPIDVFEMEESFGWCRDVALQTPIPLIVKLHGPAFLSLVDNGPDATARSIRVDTEGAAMRAARAIIAPSRSTMLDTAKKYALAPEDLVSIPNPIDAVPDALVWRRTPEWAEDILFVGRFDYRKGGDAAIQAFALLAQSRPRLRLTVVGPDNGLTLPDGSVQKFDAYVKMYVAPDIAARIRFLGVRPAIEIQALRLQCAATVLATRWESFGYVVAEAMMQGCPIAGFNVVGVNELIEHGESGLLSPLDDIAGLATHIGYLLDHPQAAAALGARARESVSSRCSAEAVVARMLAVYRIAACGVVAA